MPSARLSNSPVGASESLVHICDRQFSTLPPNRFVIPTEAQRSGGTCCAPTPQTKAICAPSLPTLEPCRGKPQIVWSRTSKAFGKALRAHLWGLRLGCRRTAGPSTALRFGRDDKFVWGQGGKLPMANVDKTDLLSAAPSGLFQDMGDPRSVEETGLMIADENADQGGRASHRPAGSSPKP